MDGPLKKLRRGLTIIESVLAMGIIGIALLSLLLVFTNGMKMLSQTSQLNTATDLGREFLEQVRFNGAALVTPGVFDGRVGTPRDPSTAFPPAPYNPNGPVKRMGGDYDLVVTADATGMPAGVIAVKVEVYWNERGKVALETYLR